MLPLLSLKHSSLSLGRFVQALKRQKENILLAAHVPGELGHRLVSHKPAVVHHLTNYLLVHPPYRPHASVPVGAPLVPPCPVAEVFDYHRVGD